MEDSISITELIEDTTLSDIDCSDEGDSYIEIELDTAPTSTCYNDDQVKSSLIKGICKDDNGEGEEEEYQLRISISSTISASLLDSQKESQLNVQTTMSNVAPPCMSSPMSCSADDTRTYADSRKIMPLQHSSVTKTDDEIEFPMQNRVFNTVSFNPRELWETTQPDGQTTILRAARVVSYNNVDVLHARKQPSLITTTKGGIMKLFIKFRGIKIGALLASFVKPQPCQANNGHKSSKKSNMFLQCHQKKLVKPSVGRCTEKRDQGRRRKHCDLENDSISGSSRSSKKYNRVMEMDLGALRGIFNAMAMSIARKGSRSKRRTQSTSCDTSPIHEEFSLCSTENSIQAAIAYCKSSFGPTSDFSF